LAAHARCYTNVKRAADQLRSERRESDDQKRAGAVHGENFESERTNFRDTVRARLSATAKLNLENNPTALLFAALKKTFGFDSFRPLQRRLSTTRLRAAMSLRCCRPGRQIALLSAPRLARDGLTSSSHRSSR